MEIEGSITRYQININYRVFEQITTNLEQDAQRPNSFTIHDNWITDIETMCQESEGQTFKLIQDKGRINSNAKRADASYFCWQC